MLPTFTIITATRNAGGTLSRLFASLVAQSFKNFEWIVQDANSTDDTLDLIKRFQQELPHVSCISEQDTGIYDAWNKALLRVRGEWVLFLGADDCLHDADALKDAAENIATLPDTVEYFASALVLTLASGEAVETWYPAHEPLAALPSCMPLPHPALFHHKRLFENKRFDPALRIAGDYDFLCRTLRPDNVRTSPRVTTRMSAGGISGSLDTMLASELECWRVSRHYFPYAFPCKLYARLCRSALYRGISALAGKQKGRAFADGIRRLQGKVPLWTRDSTKGPSVPNLPHQPHITLVIPTYQRTDPLRRLLHSLTLQSYPYFSVIVVDQNYTHPLSGLLSEFPTLSFKHSVISPAGVSHARNTALAHAHGDIIAFPDDDCCYAPDTLARVVDFFTTHAGAGGVLGVWAEGADQIATQDAANIQITRQSAFRGAGTLVQFYRREVVEAVGSFDELLGPGTGLPYGCGEDTDYLLRALEAGFSVWRDPAVHLFHPLPDFLRRDLAPKWLSYGRGRMHLLKKHHFPLWFKLANVLYPLALLPLDFVRQGKHAALYRWAMFRGRLQGLFL